MKIRKSILILLLFAGWFIYKGFSSEPRQTISKTISTKDHLEEYFFNQWYSITENIKNESLSVSFPSKPSVLNRNNRLFFNARHDLADYELEVIPSQNLEESMLLIDKELEPFENAPHARILHIKQNYSESNYIREVLATNLRNPLRGDEVIYKMKFIATENNLYILSAICDFGNIEYYTHFTESFSLTNSAKRDV